MTSLVADLPFSDGTAELSVANGITELGQEENCFKDLENFGEQENVEEFISAEELAKITINHKDFINQEFYQDDNSLQESNESTLDQGQDSDLNCLICQEVFEDRKKLSEHIVRHLKKPKLILQRCKVPAGGIVYLNKKGSFARKRVRPYNNKNFISQVIEPEVNPDNPNFPAVPKLRILLPSQLSQQVDNAIESSKNNNKSGENHENFMRPLSASSNSSLKSEMVPNDSPSFHSQSTDLSSNFWGQDNESHTSSDSGIQIREIRESGDKEVERHDSLLQNFLNDTVSVKDPGMILPGPTDTEFISLERLAGPQCQICGERFVDKPSFEVHCKVTGHYNPSSNSHNSLVPFSSSNMLSNPLESLSNLSMSQLAQSVNRLQQNGPPVQQNVMINIQQFGHQMPQRSPYDMPPHHMGPMYPPHNSMHHPMGPYPPHGPPMGPHGPQMPPHVPPGHQYPNQYPTHPMYYPHPGGYNHAPPQHAPPRPPQHAPPPPRPPQQPPSPTQGSMMPPRPPPPRMPQNQPRTSPPQNVRPPAQRPQGPPRPIAPRAPIMRVGPPTNIRPQQNNVRGPNPQTRPVGSPGSKITLVKRNGSPPATNDVKKKRMDVLIPDTNDDADCHVISMQKCNDGLPVIKNVQGATSAPDPVVHLTDSITLSVRNPKEAPKEAPQPQKKNDAKAVANILATRGITVTPASKTTKESSPTPEKIAAKPAPVAINLNSAVSIIPTAKNQSSSPTPPSNKPAEKSQTVDLTEDEPQKQTAAPQTAKRSLPYTCDLCPAQYPTMKSLMSHRRQYHKAGPHGELGIPIIDLSQPTVLAKLQSLGIQNYIPLPQSGTNGTFGMPIVSVNGARNPSVCNLGALGSGAVLTLGPLHRLNNLPVNTNKQ